MKTAAKAIALLVGVILVGATGVFGWYKHQESSFAATTVPYIMATVPTLAQWEPDVVKAHLTPEARNAMSDAELDTLMNWFRKLGPLKSIDEPSLTNIYSALDGSGAKILTYSVPAHFEAGDAVISLRLVQSDGSYKIHAFHVNSTALAR